MLDYRSDQDRTRPRAYATRAAQYRLLVLVFAVLGVVFLTIEARNPENWQWMFGDAAQSRLEPNVRDTSWPDDASESSVSLPEGVFLAPQVPSAKATDVESTPGKRDLDMARHHFLFLHDVDFSAVKDDTVFRSAESKVWYGLLSGLTKLDADTLRGHSVGNVHFNQLFDAPSTYRGSMVEVTGIVRRAHYLPAPRNDYGVPGYWQCWLFPDYTDNPIVVYATHMPDEFPSGMKLAEHATFVGVFFKRWAYRSASGTRRAPLMVSGACFWQPAEPDFRESQPSLSQLTLFLCMALFVVYALFRLVPIRTTVRRSTISRQSRSKDLEFRPIVAVSDSVHQATTDYLQQLTDADQANQDNRSATRD